MDYIKSNDSNLYGVIKDIFKSSLSNNKLNISDSFFSHNTNYKNGISIIKQGILSANEKENKKICDFVLQGISNVNGRNFVSVSKDENITERGMQMTYNASNPQYLNFLINENKLRKFTRVMRCDTNYVNEYLVENYIPANMFIGIETRLLKYINLLEKNSKIYKTENLIRNYNQLIDIIKYINKNNIDIPIFESSEQKNKINTKEFIYCSKKII